MPLFDNKKKKFKNSHFLKNRKKEKIKKERKN